MQKLKYENTRASKMFRATYCCYRIGYCLIEIPNMHGTIQIYEAFKKVNNPKSQNIWKIVIELQQRLRNNES
jgi:hypothetical protein